MERQPYRPDRRREAQIVDAFGRSAAASRHDAWRSHLFRKGEHGYELVDRKEPSGALLAAVAHVLEKLVGQFDELPHRYRLACARRLDPERAQMAPDQVFVAFEGSSPQLPVEIAAGTEIAALEPDGKRRSYTLDHAVTVLPARLGAVAGWMMADDGIQELRSCPVVDGAIGAAFDPFPRSDGPRTRLDARVYFGTPVLCAAVPGAVVTVRFTRTWPEAETFAARIAALEWSISSGLGFATVLPDVRVSSASEVVATVEMPTSGARAALEQGAAGMLERGSEPALRWSLPDRLRGDASLDLAFGDVRVEVAGQDLRSLQMIASGKLASPLVGVEPFGKNPAPGVLFHVGSQALAAPLSICELDWQGLPDGRVPVEPIYEGQEIRAPGVPCLLWEALRGGAWVPLAGVGGQLAGHQGCTDSLCEVLWFRSDDTGNAISGSSKAVGIAGHWIRARLRNGDFGSSKHLAELRAYADALMASAVARPGIVAKMWQRIRKLLHRGPHDAPSSKSGLPPPPSPPRIQNARLSFRTHEARPARENLTVHAAVGLSRLRQIERLDGRFAPFAVSRPAVRGAILVGLDGPALAEASLSILLDVDAVSVSTHPQQRVRAELLIDGAWVETALEDGTHGLRQAGVVRLRCSNDWQPQQITLPGCPTRPMLWWRLTFTNEQPEVLLRRASLHATVATLGSDVDSTATRFPVEGQAKLVRPVAGIKVNTVLQAAVGRAAEGDEEYMARVGHLGHHRLRGVSCHDVERLLHGEFRELALVRCLPASAAPATPGTMRVMIVPDSPKRLPVATSALVQKVEQYLQEHSAVTARAILVEPTFVPVVVHVRVRATPGQTVAVVAQQIEAALQRFVHPGRGAGHTRFDQRLTAASVWRFLLGAELPIASIVFVRFESTRTRGDSVDPLTGSELLVSAPHHEVEVLQ
ncbi:MAG: baseplate J/gp47 family protein [Planctomycetota bacterium]